MMNADTMIAHAEVAAASPVAPAAPVVLEVSGLSARYGKVEALHGAALKLRAGQIVTVIGPNGAGKSTLLNAIMGALPVNGSSSGRVLYEGHDLSSLDVEERVARGLSLVPEKRELFGTMSVEDNLQLGAYKRHRNGERDYMDQLDSVLALSGGERQMLAVGRALMAKPQVLMLDEPSLGLAPLITREILGIISALRDTGVATLLVEQNARAALQVADYGYVLEMGELVKEGPAGELAADKQIVESYLGLARK